MAYTKNDGNKFMGIPKPVLLAIGIAAFILLAVVAIVLLASSSRLSGGCIGVIDVRGEILADDSPDTLFSQGQTGSGTIASLIEKADVRDDVRGILVVIDSPGGSPLGSREIYSALKNSSKPKVSYMRELAASGGYYVAAGTDYIVSEPDTLTGSIGVRASVSDLSGLFSKLGYNETVIKSGNLKDIGSSSRPMTEEERQILQSIVNESFAEFKQVVVSSRGSKLVHPQFEQILDARVLTGRQAKAIGLVDELGGQKVAERHLSSMLNSSEPLPLCSISASRGGLFSSLLSGSLAWPPLAAAQGVHLSYQ